MSDDQVQRLADISEIAQLKARYCRCVDTKDWDGYGALVTDDFHAVTDSGVHEGRDAVVSYLSGALGNAVTVHHVHQPEVMFTAPDRAEVIWAMNDYVEIPLGEASFVLRGYGHYHEDYVRTAEGWRMQRTELKRLRVDTEGGAPSAAE
jgi:hypothetical protein